MSSKLKKVVDESRDSNNPELDLGDRGIVNIVEVPGLSKSSGNASSSWIATCGNHRNVCSVCVMAM